MNTLERIKLVGKVIGEPSVIIGRPISCKVTIEVPDNTGAGYETYDVIVTKKYKPWQLEVGTKICAIGVLRGHELWCDYFKEYPPPGR